MVHHMQENLARLNMEDFCVLAWSLWNERNNRLHSKKSYQAKLVVEKVYSYIEEVLMARLNQPKQPRDSSLNRLHTWCKPMRVYFKLNPSLDLENEIIGTGT